MLHDAPSKSDHRHELEDRLKFETLLTDISAHFVNLPVEQIDSKIEDAQRRVCECLGLDLSALWQWSTEKPHIMTLTHVHSPPEGPSQPEQIDAQEAFPWALQKMLRGETLAFSTKNMPQEATRDQESRRQFGVKSSVVIPLSAGGGSVTGAISFDTLWEERVWFPRTVKRLTLVAQVFINALERKRSEQHLRDSEARLNLAADSAEAGLWELDCSSGLFWATEKALTIFGFGPEDIIDIERFEASIYPEDLELVQQAIARALDEREPINIEYRIRVGGGRMKWIASRGRPFFKPTGEPIRLIGVSIDINERKHMEKRLSTQLEEIKTLKLKLEKENIYLRQEVELQHVHEEIVGRSTAMKHVLAKAEQVARTDAIVLIQGETGTGKELIARAVHRLSTRKEQPMVTVNCASLPPTLIESELFGREKGAYTGALTRMIGRFEVADRGTLFLDEIGDLPLEVQAKLLRVLEQGSFERLGSTQSLKVDVRIIAATNKVLERYVETGRFRKDLFFRLNVFPIHLPPLKERIEDIPPLVWKFIRQFEKKMGRRVDHISSTCMDDLKRYAWPGNIRELRNVIERALIGSSGRTLKVRPPREADVKIPMDLNLEDVERRHILGVLQKTGWRISGQGGAAGILGLKRTTLQSRMKKLGIRRLAQ
jgi:formate hydrogenlyase transcriptional activator